MKAVVIIPTFNEAQSILGTLRQLLWHTDANVRVLVVDDQSPDGTAALVKSSFVENPRVAVLERTAPRSFAGSYREGFARALEDASVEAIMEMDADMSHHPRYVPSILQHLRNHDVVIGSRYARGGDVANFSLHRKCISRAANLYARALTRVPVRDITAGFVAYRRALLERFPFEKLQSDGYGFQIEMKYHAHQLGARFFEIPIAFRDRYNGKSKMNRRMIWEGLRIGWQLQGEQKKGYRADLP